MTTNESYNSFEELFKANGIEVEHTGGGFYLALKRTDEGTLVVQNYYPSSMVLYRYRDDASEFYDGDIIWDRPADDLSKEERETFAMMVDALSCETGCGMEFTYRGTEVNYEDGGFFFEDGDYYLSCNEVLLKIDERISEQETAFVSADRIEKMIDEIVAEETELIDRAFEETLCAVEKIKNTLSIKKRGGEFTALNKRLAISTAECFSENLMNRLEFFLKEITALEQKSRVLQSLLDE